MSKAPDLSMFTKGEIREVLSEVRNPLSIAIFGSDNYFNGAAIIRTAHQFLVKDIYLVDCPKIYEKATMGTHKWENISHLTFEDFSTKFSQNNLVVCERREGLPSENLVTFSYPENPILCFGSEKGGVPQSLVELASNNHGKFVTIPQFGILNDLNLACAAGIVMYDWICKNYYKKS